MHGAGCCKVAFAVGASLSSTQIRKLFSALLLLRSSSPDTMATRDIPLTPIDSRATTNRTTEASESGILNNAEPAPGTRVVEALDSYPDGGTEAWMQVRVPIECCLRYGCVDHFRRCTDHCRSPGLCLLLLVCRLRRRDLQLVSATFNCAFCSDLRFSALTFALQGSAAEGSRRTRVHLHNLVRPQLGQDSLHTLN